MKTINQPAQAGTIESGDILVTLMPGEANTGIIIDLDSLVLAQYGEAIRQTIVETLQGAGLNTAYIKAIDRGALDCTIRARVKAALKRAGVPCQEVAI